MPSILTRLGLALINVRKAGLPFEVKTQTPILSARMHQWRRRYEWHLTFCSSFCRLKRQNSLNYSVSLQTLWLIDTIIATTLKNEVRKGWVICQWHEREQGRIRTSEPFPSAQLWTILICFFKKEGTIIVSSSFQGISTALKSMFYSYL